MRLSGRLMVESGKHFPPLPRLLCATFIALAPHPRPRYFLNYSPCSNAPRFSWSCTFNLRPTPPPPSSPIEILIAYAAPLPPPGQSDCNFSPACLVGYRMNVMKSGLQKCVRRQRAAAARACCDALAKQDLGQVIEWLR
jgi:hypothetical protein